MSRNKVIVLTDSDGATRYFDIDSLVEQLAFADLPGTAPIKAAYRNLANKVAEMRREQSAFFSAQIGSPVRENHLRRAKKLEQEVDAIIKAFNVVLEKL